jgi:hypothetical protein
VEFEDCARDDVDLEFASEGLVFIEIDLPVGAGGFEILVVWDPPVEVVFG